MKNTIKELAQKYDVQSIINRLEQAENSKTIKIGFIGEFSSGKTSLINSVLGTKLPVDINPCTKAITVIEPTEGIEQGNFNYFIDKGEERTFVDFNEFSQIANGGEIGVCGIQVPPTEVLPQGCVFIDTPGIHSVGGNEAALTYGYLSLLDAAVFCIDINSGTINAPALDFLKNNVPSIIRNRIIFALTFTDKILDDSDIKDIVNNIKNELDKTGIIDDAEKKILCVSNLEDNSEKLYGFLQNSVLNNLTKILKDRELTTCKEIGLDLLTILKEQKKYLNFDADEINNQINEIKEREKEIVEAQNNQKENLENFRSKLESTIQSFISGNRFIFEDVTNQKEVIEAKNEMFSHLFEMINIEISNFIKKDYSIPPFLMAEMANSLQSRLNNIIKTRDISVTASTMIATSVILPATGLLGNAGEAAAGGAAATVAKEAGKKAAEKEAIKKLPNMVGELAKGIGTFVREVNPLEWVGDYLSKGYKTEAVLDISKMAPHIAKNIINNIEPIYEEKFYSPLLEQQKECSKALKNMRNQLNSGFSDFNNKVRDMTNDIYNLENLLK